MGKEQDVYDVTIVGGGPAGLFASFYAGLREMKTKIIDAHPMLGGKVHFYPDKLIWDVGGLTPITGMKLMDQMIEQGLTFYPTVVLNETVQTLKKDEGDAFCMHTSSGIHYSKTVILATGGGIFNPIKLDLENAHLFEQGNLHYNVKRLADFKDKRILISGGGNSAIDWANELASIAKQVTLIYRGEELKGHEKEVSRLKGNNVACYINTQIEGLIGEAPVIRIVELKNNLTLLTDMLEVDEVIVNHGFSGDKSLLSEGGLDIARKDEYYVDGNAAAESSVPGLYAAGDMLSYNGKLRLIAGAFQDAVNAVNSAKLFLEPDASKIAVISTHNERLKDKNKKYLYS